VELSGDTYTRTQGARFESRRLIAMPTRAKSRAATNSSTTYKNLDQRWSNGKVASRRHAAAKKRLGRERKENKWIDRLLQEKHKKNSNSEGA